MSVQRPVPARSYSRCLECSCCGEDRDASTLLPLQCHEEIKICRICAHWLVGRTGGIDVTQALLVADMTKTIEFWEAAGFDVNRYDGFAFVSFDEQSVFYLDLVEGFDLAANCAGCYITTDQTEPWHARFAAAGMIVTSMVYMPWGMRECTVTDPNGNRIRIGRSTPGCAEGRPLDWTAPRVDATRLQPTWQAMTVDAGH